MHTDWPANMFISEDRDTLTQKRSKILHTHKTEEDKITVNVPGHKGYNVDSSSAVS